MLPTGWRAGLPLCMSPLSDPGLMSATIMINCLFNLVRRVVRVREAITTAHCQQSGAMQAAATPDEQCQARQMASAATQHLEGVMIVVVQILGMSLWSMSMINSEMLKQFCHLHLQVDVFAPVKMSAHMRVTLSSRLRSSVAHCCAQASAKRPNCPCFGHQCVT